MSTGVLNPTPWLLADIGGTHARLGLLTDAKATVRAVERWPTAQFNDLTSLVTAALDKHPEIKPNTLACAIASPINGDTVSLTNAGWTFSVEATRQALDLERLVVVNDWVAQGWFIAHETPENLRCLHSGIASNEAPRLALGPGTGLGSALVTPFNPTGSVFSTEGGHISFAPTSEREAAVAKAIQAAHGHCSAERLASGLGIETLDRTLHHLEGLKPSHRSAQTIAQAAKAGDVIAKEALGLFTQALGSVAGDLALASGARGGIFWGGGLIPALGELFDFKAMHKRFCAKGRFSDYLRPIPHYFIANEQAALRGLGHYLTASAHQARIN